ncbi:MAG: SURF1 family protein [Pseudomonadota bacterium]
MKFKTSGGLTLLLAGLFVVFVLLGNWQRDRAEGKRISQQDFDTAASVTALSDALPAWTRARLAGELDTERHLLLENKLYRGRAGVHVLTPYTLAGGATLLVNRGWLPLPPDRSSLPAVETPSGLLDLSGRLAPISQPGVQIGEPATLQADRWPQLMVYPDWDRIEAALGQPMHHQVLYLDADSAAGFEDRNWTPFTMGPDRHMAYAVQWYGLALTAVATWLVLGFTAGRRQTA